MTLTVDEARLLAHLQQRWGELFRLTTLDQGMLALGQAPDHARRVRLGDELLAQPSLHPTVERWGARTVILTEGEKLLGRHLAQLAEEGRDEVGLVDAAATLEASVDDVERGLRTLAHLDLLTYRAHDGVASFSFRDGWRTLLGPLGFAFHTVQREGGERFNVP